MGEIRVAIAGVGNCASSLVQGLEFYKDTNGEKVVPGLMHTSVNGYAIKDIKIVVGFDVDKRKVGKDVSQAIFEKPNCTTKFSDVPNLDAPVLMGNQLDGVAELMENYSNEESFVPSEEKPADVVKELKERKVDILVNYMPVGSEKAAKFYAEACLEAGCALINCMPVFIASNEEWANKFREKGIPILGDDIKSQVGATIIHRVLTKLFGDRGMEIDRTYQLNVGGNTDFLNMTDRERLKSKKISKTESVQSQMRTRFADNNIHIGPSDYVPWMNDNKVCFLRMEGKHFGGVPMNIEMRLSVEDSPNSAGIVIDAIRVAKTAIDRGIAGPIKSASSYYFKHPPEQFRDEKAKELLEEFIEGKRSD